MAKVMFYKFFYFSNASKFLVFRTTQFFFMRLFFMMQVLVWHTRSENPTLIQEKQLKRKGLKPSNYGMEE